MSAWRLMGPTVARHLAHGPCRGWWILNKRETGWSSYGFRYDDLATLLREWDAQIGERGEDEHGPYVEVYPRETEP